MLGKLSKQCAPSRVDPCVGKPRIILARFAAKWLWSRMSVVSFALWLAAVFISGGKISAQNGPLGYFPSTENASSTLPGIPPNSL
jgi:hypothetical protein